MESVFVILRAGKSINHLYFYILFILYLKCFNNENLQRIFIQFNYIFAQFLDCQIFEQKNTNFKKLQVCRKVGYLRVT